MISNLYVGARGEICNAQTAETDVLRLADAERFFQTLVFDGESDTRGHVVTRVTTAIMRVCHGEAFSVSYIVFSFDFLFAFTFGRGRRCHARSGRLPNEPAPFIRLAE